MWTDSTLQPVHDNAPYTSPSGTQYPAGFPKSAIPGLHAVTLTSQPTDPSLVVTGFTIDNGYTQVWATRAKSDAEQLSEMQSQARIALNKADETMLRVQEAVSLGLTAWTADDVVAWTTYRRALRILISSATVEALPSQPAYPMGT